MEREEFLSKLGIGLAAICGGGCFAACTKEYGDEPEPTGGNVTTINLTTDIKNVGDAKTSNGVIVVRLNPANFVTSFTAVQVACTHEGSTIAYSPTLNKFVCPSHGSEFSTTGAVLKGPAPSNLKKYNLTLAGDILTVTAVTS